MRLIHRLVVETCADDVKWCHGDRHSHPTDHGSYQSREPAVWTEPLEGKTLMISWGVDFWLQLFIYMRAAEMSAGSHMHLGM